MGLASVRSGELVSMLNVIIVDQAVRDIVRAGVARPGTHAAIARNGREDTMGTHSIRRSSPRVARALLALLLAALWVAGLPPTVQGATSYKVLYGFPLPASQLSVTPSGLLQAADGNFYATTYYGGVSESGSVFQLTPAGTLTTLYSFPGETGGVYPSPYAGLILGSDGNFYGTTYDACAPPEHGTVFKVTPGGVLTPLHTFTGTDGECPQAGLLRDADGNLYGTTTYGGGPGLGTVFKLALDGTLTTLHPFSGSDGASPQAGLVRAPDGTLYGTTLGDDGASNYGTVFQLTPAGETYSFDTIYTFSCADGACPHGANPLGTLLRDPDGTLYGTTVAGGTANLGTVFKLTPTGSLITLHSFSGTDGAPSAGLFRGTDGNLYGTTYGPCPYEDSGCTSASGYGTVFRLATDGSAFTALYNFTGPDGANPQTPVIQGTDGYFYGTTSRGGGAGKRGVFFFLRVGNTLTLIPAGTGNGTVTSAPAGINCGATCSEVFPTTATVTLTPAPAVSSTFTGWSGTGITCPGTDPCSVPMTQAQTVTATFTLKSFALTIQKGGTGAGTVTGTVNTNPTTLNCGTTCSVNFDYNTVVTLTASPIGTSVFTGWSGAGCSNTGTCQVTMTAAQTVTATFAPPTAHLTVKVGGSSDGTVTSNPSVVTCTAACGVDIDSGTVVTLTATATPGAGGTFKGWTGDCTGAGTCQVTMSAAKTVTAVFTKTFTDPTLTAGSTPIKAVHFTDLRAAVGALRLHYGGGTVTWTDSTLTPGVTAVKAQHLLELRTGLDGAYTAAAKIHAAYAETIGPGTLIKASHLNELRSLVKNLVCLVNGICEP
jgi:uncharacterized repeat protein (TIGR03803 family)